MKKLLMVVALVTVTGCTTSSDEAKNAVNGVGISEYQDRGLSFFGCGEKDKYGRKFSGKNIRGERVTGVVCCGVLKGCTVRF